MFGTIILPQEPPRRTKRMFEGLTIVIPQERVPVEAPSAPKRAKQMFGGQFAPPSEV
jgi:hypothetical protein